MSRNSFKGNMSRVSQLQCRQDIVPRLCILTSAHLAFDIRIFHKEAKTVACSGYEVTLIAQHEQGKKVDGVKIIGLAKARNRFHRIFGLTWRAFHLALKQKAAIYHFHDPELLPWGRLLQKIARKPVIYDIHEYYALDDRFPSDLLQ